MSEIRLAGQGDLERQKEIWRLCFGDPRQYIELFYNYRSKTADSFVLVVRDEIAAMLTVLPVKLVTPARDEHPGAMLYAVATHPAYQGQGLARELLTYTNEYLQQKGCSFTLVVPAKEGLQDYYARLGYEQGFMLGEAVLTEKMMVSRPADSSPGGRLTEIEPAEYNYLRNNLLQRRLYIVYSEEDIAYQQGLSRLSGLGLYAMEYAGGRVCAALEEISPEKVMAKELLGPKELLAAAARQIIRLTGAQQLLVRTPVFLFPDWYGAKRAFAMVRQLKPFVEIATLRDCGYLGLAFD